MLHALRICLAILGVSAIAIALSIMILGAGATASLAESAFDAVSGWHGPPSGRWPATMDSELRFYAALWGAYGIIVLRAASGLPRTLPWAPWIAAVFFAGGLGRVLSRVRVGPPHPFFTLLMTLELTLPLSIAGLWLGGRSQARRG